MVSRSIFTLSIYRRSAQGLVMHYYFLKCNYQEYSKRNAQNKTKNNVCQQKNECDHVCKDDVTVSA
ncbi:hypothetical protein T4D_2374 [Trichinella pseudospiralis]|uniref:Uncharacterized protein n=1 Tax=Trichinella pseudospiralis TaxID=6337 RepID=A0A0V1G1Z5_TRIPS|nr:hypothetical protein T4D_2374 [Trichinella pseudospiralis]